MALYNDPSFDSIKEVFFQVLDLDSKPEKNLLFGNFMIKMNEWWGRSIYTIRASILKNCRSYVWTPSDFKEFFGLGNYIQGFGENRKLYSEENSKKLAKGIMLVMGISPVE